ncbi:TPA: MFS transporter [Staphylococcus pseudintermedius]|nr:MFS transporter [Staphylococcus pseudintermedius]EJD8521221.1 MFS transporter [Staphylococcus pseudintermedius]HAR6574034.1 MFS transporter [Staphylococcus pseudintermedius]
MKNYNYYILANIFSFLGNSLFSVAVTIFIIEKTGKSELLGNTFALTYIPVLVITLLSGHIVDIISRKSMAIILDIIGALICIVGYLLLSLNFNIYVVALTLIITNSIKAIFSVNNKVLIKDISKLKEETKRLNTIQSFIKQTFELISPIAVTSILYFMDPIIFFLINGVSFVISLFFTLLLKVNHTSNITKSMKEIKISSSNQRIVQCFSFLAAINNLFLSALQLFISFYFIETLNNKNIFSLVLLFQGLGALSAPLLLKLRYFNDKLILNLFLSSLGLMMCVGTSLLLYLGIFIFSGFLTVYNINFYTYLQYSIKENQLGKALSIVNFTSMITIPIGNYLIGKFMNLIVPVGFQFFGIAILINLILFKLITYKRNINVV